MKNALLGIGVRKETRRAQTDPGKTNIGGRRKYTNLRWEGRKQKIPSMGEGSVRRRRGEKKGDSHGALFLTARLARACGIGLRSTKQRRRPANPTSSSTNLRGTSRGGTCGSRGEGGGRTYTASEFHVPTAKETGLKIESHHNWGRKSDS